MLVEVAWRGSVTGRAETLVPRGAETLVPRGAETLVPRGSETLVPRGAGMLHSEEAACALMDGGGKLVCRERMMEGLRRCARCRCQ